MVFSDWRSLVRRNSKQARYPSRPRGGPRRHRPGIELLEDRSLPSTTLLPGGGQGGYGGQSGPNSSPDAADAERSLTDPTAWWVYDNVDLNFLSARITQDNARIIDLKVKSTAPERFSAVLVQNTGVYAKPWWWFVDQSAADLAAQLPGRRLIDLETYFVGGQQKFAAVMVPNTGAQAKPWWYYYNASVDFISAQLQANNARIVDLDSYVVNGQRLFSTVMVANQGIDAEPWSWWVNVSAAFVSSQLQQSQGRLLDLVPQSDGTFSVVIVPSQGIHWWWYFGQTGQGLLNKAVQNGARLIDIEPYTVGDQSFFAGIMVNNSNALTTRVGDILRGASDTATNGLYLKEVGGPVWAALEENYRFEPASMIKVLIHLHVMRQVQAGPTTLRDSITYYFKPDDPNNPNVCPSSYAHTPANARTITLEAALQGMMQVSDNRMTQAVEDRFTSAAINATASSIGMSNSVLGPGVVIGCGLPGNFLTLVDAGKLYEQVENGTLFQQPYRDRFYSLMLQGGIWPELRNVVTQEAAAQLSKPSGDPAVQALVNAFGNDVSWAAKGGSYTLSAGARSWRVIRTGGAVTRLPYHNTLQQTLLKSFVWGEFIENALVSGPATQIDNAMNNARDELLRDPVHEALATWRPAAVASLTPTPISDHQINLTWSAVPGASGYKVEVFSGLFWGEIGTTGAGVTTFADGGLVGGTQYRYRVRATGLGGDGAYSPEASAFTYVSAPSNLTAIAVSTSQINLSWSPVNGTNEYKVERSLDGSNWSQIAVTAPNITSLADTGLVASTRYYYRVRGHNVSGDGAYSPVASDMTRAVVGLRVLANTSQTTAGAVFSITVTAIDSSNNVAAGYRGTVHFTTSDPFGSTCGDHTFSAADAGVFACTSATLFTAGTQTYTATDTIAPLLTAATNNITVVPAAADHFQIDSSNTVTSGMAFDVTVTALDPYGNTDTNYTGTITFTSTDADPGVLLPADYTFTLADAGVVVFPAGVTLIRVGDQTLTVADTVSGITGSTLVTVTAGAYGPAGRGSLLAIASEAVPFPLGMQEAIRADGPSDHSPGERASRQDIVDPAARVSLMRAVDRFFLDGAVRSEARLIHDLLLAPLGEETV